VCSVRLRQQVGRERRNTEGGSLGLSVDGRRDRPYLPVPGGESCGTTQVHGPQRLAAVERDGSSLFRVGRSTDP